MSIEDSQEQMDHIEDVLTSDEVVKIAKKISGVNSVRVLNCSLSDDSNDKLDFTATHHILKITVQKSDSNDRKTLSAFVKIVSLPLFEDINKNEIELSIWISDRESFFLKTLVSQFTDSYKGEKWWPTHYYTSKNVVVLEDLKSNGYKVLDKFVDNYTVLKSVLVSLARFHACSILAEARISEKRSVALNELYKDKFRELILLLSGEGASWFISAMKMSCTLAEHFGYDPTKIRKLFVRSCDMIKPSKIHRNTVCHSEVHYNNLMFADCSPLPKCVLVNFQAYRYAPLVTDILQFLHFNTTAKFREEHEASLIEFYHSVLSETVTSYGSTKRAELPTLEDIFKGMEDLRLYGLVIACIYFPILYLDPELMRKNARDAEFNKNLLADYRTEFTFEQMKVNKVMKNKIEEAFRELVEKSDYNSL